MLRSLGIAFLTTLCVLPALAAPVPTEAFDVTKEREWQFQDLGIFRGTLVKYEKGKVFIKMSDGVVRDFYPGSADGLSGSFLQRAVAKMPAKPTLPNLAAGQGPVVDISADKLPPGPLTAWKNGGRAGGNFSAMNQPLKVADVDGRRAVLFEQVPWLLPLDYQTMVSDFYLPEPMINGQPITVVAWLYNTGPATDRETFLCWGEKDCGELDTPDFSYGTYESMQWYDERMPIASGKFPKLHEWHQLAFVLTPSDKDKNRCELKLYVDGNLNTSKLVRRPPAKLLTNNLVFLGCAWEAWWGKKWASRPSRTYHGAMAGLKIFDRALTEAELRQLNGTEYFSSPSPANGSHDATAQTKLSWQGGAPSAKGAKVFFSTDRAAVERGDAAVAKAVAGDQPACDPGPLAAGQTYYWRVEVPGARGTAPLWTFSVGAGGAVNPQPANGAREVMTHLELLSWKPNPDANDQVLHFGTDKAAVASGTATKVKLKSFVEEAYLLMDLQLERLEPGKTYYWRIEPIIEGKAAPALEPWSFTTSEFALEFDGPVSEPWPSEIPQKKTPPFVYDRIFDAGGYPVLSLPGNTDVHLRAVRHGMQKFFTKRPDLVTVLQASNSGANLSSDKARGWGWSPFVCSAYGFGEAMLREDPIMMHEMGHQLQMHGAAPMEPDFFHRYGEVFNAARRDRVWMGDYGGNNMWENMACCASWWINGLGDMSKDEGDVRTRELLRRHDPRVYHLLADYWPGDTMIELDPVRGIKADAAGKVLEWANSAGIEYFKPRVGWRFYERSTGRFLAGAGKPAVRTVAGVTAMAFAGSDALGWDKTTWDSLDGNRSWSADLWVYRDAAPSGEQTLVDWGTAAAPGAKLTWGASDLACTLPGGVSVKWTRKPEPGRWHHLVWVFTGGKAEDGPGELRVYVDGKLDATAKAKLALPASARVTVGQGFTGAIARARIYNYDLHPLQVDALWKKETPAYQGDSLAVAGRLLVNLDARLLGPVEDPETWPVYPASLNKPWLRSWVNRGILGGKVHNDVRVPDASQPRVAVAQGAKVISFDGKSHMASDFMAPAPAEGTVEMWVFPEAGAAQTGAVLQWGAWNVPAKTLKPGAWQHVAVTFEKAGATLYVNGTKAGAPAPIGAAPAGAAERLVLGGNGDGKTWAGAFRGHIAQVRIHEGVLKPEQILANISGSDVRRPTLPEPALDAEVVVARQPALSWQSGIGAAGTKCDVYVGTNPAEVAAAERTSPLFLGAKNPGELRPRLSPATRYYWRVDGLDAKGAVRARGPLWSFATCEGAVLDLNAADVTAGPVKAWPNKGSGRGTFVLASERETWKPTVTNVGGRNSVDFGGRKGLISSFAVPQALSGGGSFTVALWGFFNEPHGLLREQTLLSWGRRGVDHFELCWGWSWKTGAFVGGQNTSFGFKGPMIEEESKQREAFRHNAPMPEGWRHFAYVYNGQAKTLRIYVDGVLNREDPVTLNIKPGENLALGGVRTGRGLESGFNGFMGEVAVSGAALSEADIAKLAQGVPAASVPGNWLVRLDPKELPAGLLSSWPNKGSLGGEFGLEAESIIEPKAETVSGKPAVTFDGQKNLLRSDLPTPARLTGDRPMTVEMWVLNPKMGDTETIFGLAPTVAYKSYPQESSSRSANFNMGMSRDGVRDDGIVDLRPALFNTGAQGRNVAWKGTPPNIPAEWQHLAYVYSGGWRGTFKVYLNGQLVNDRTYFTIAPIAGYPMSLGGAWHTARGMVNGFSGSVARVQAFDYARTEEEIRAAAAAK